MCSAFTLTCHKARLLLRNLQDRISISYRQRDISQVEQWQSMQMSDASAKLLIYQAFIEDEPGFPKHLARRVHDRYFEPIHEEFQPRTMWSLSNAFTSAFKDLEPIPRYKVTAKLAGFLQSVRTS